MSEKSYLAVCFKLLNNKLFVKAENFKYHQFQIHFLVSINSEGKMEMEICDWVKETPEV